MRWHILGIYYVAAITTGSVTAATDPRSRELRKRADAADPFGNGRGDDAWEPSESRKKRLDEMRGHTCASCITACMFNQPISVEEAPTWPRRCTIACSAVLVDAMEAMQHPERLQGAVLDDPERYMMKVIADAWASMISPREVVWAADHFSCHARDIPAEALARFNEVIELRRRMRGLADNADNNFELLQPGELEGKTTPAPRPQPGNVWRSMWDEMKRSGLTIFRGSGSGAGRGWLRRVPGH